MTRAVADEPKLDFRKLNREELISLIENDLGMLCCIRPYMILRARWDVASKQEEQAYAAEQQAFLDWENASQQNNQKWSRTLAMKSNKAFEAWEKARVLSKRKAATQKRLWNEYNNFLNEEAGA